MRPFLPVLCLLVLAPFCVASAPVTSTAPATTPATTTAPAAADAAKRTRAISTISNLKTALEEFEIDTGRYPTTAEGLSALVKAPPEVKASWAGPYIDGVPPDPWGHPYIYRGPDKEAAGDFNIISPGPDGKEGTPDDIDRYSKPAPAAATTPSPATAPAAAPLVPSATDLATIFAPAAAAEAKRKHAIATIANLKSALDEFEVDNGRYPTTAEGLAALVIAPADCKATWSRYVESVPLDPWGHPYIYHGPDATKTADFNVISPGPDGKEGTPDDIDGNSK